jgi:uncharacterized membrane protein
VSHPRPRSLHYWLRTHFFYPLVAISLLAIAMFLGWRLTGQPWGGPRLLLNLGLAWCPYILSLGLAQLWRHLPQARTAWWILFAVWLAFFPNAAYLITDWLYLPHFRTELWYSIGLFMTFSLCGILLSVTSLYLVHTMLRARMGPVESGTIVGVALLLSGLGVYLGRFVRLNSWDLVTAPRKVLDDVTEHLSNPAYDANPLYFTLGFALLLAVMYGVFVSLRNAPRSHTEIAAWEHLH